MTELDHQINGAITSLNDSGKEAKPFDVDSYIAAFRESAREKATNVLEHIQNIEFFVGKKPVFVSVGGGDGEELDSLLQNSAATDGILIELSDVLAQRARQRTLPSGKSLHVINKAAQDGLSEAMAMATQLVAKRAAETIVVTGHAVLHELYDRGLRGGGFDVVGFFSNIFYAPEIPTLFTYREPGAPEKWPEVVVLAANCSAQSLLNLASVITGHHQSLADLSPTASIVGDGIRVHKDLAMEILFKLFYLKDLHHEIQERVTAVQHRNLKNALATAIGDRPRHEHRTQITSYSAPTKSFIKRWEMLKVLVNGINPDHSSYSLGIAESQTRVVAWRIPEKPRKPFDPDMPSDIALAQDAWENRDFGLLRSVLFSRGRAWVEAGDTTNGVKLLKEVADNASPAGLEALWSHYLVLIQGLFGGNLSGLEFFEHGNQVAHLGLKTLFRAEQMEYLRKGGKKVEALEIANELASQLTGITGASSDLDSYAFGTSNLLLSNFLRFGGRYEEALRIIELAKGIFKPGILSHATELSHCFYAKQVCIAMTGLASFSSLGVLDGQEFAAALIELSYSHAAWFIGDIGRAERHANEAAARFEQIGKSNYAARARALHGLLQAWQALDKGEKPSFDGLPTDLKRGVAALVTGEDSGFLHSWFAGLRPSRVVGLLQFAKHYSKRYREALDLQLPLVLHSEQKGWLWGEVRGAGSLAEANRLLREQIQIPDERRIPLIAD